MIIIFIATCLLSVGLYFLYTFIKKEKPYKFIAVSIFFITLAISILTLITYLF